MKKLVLAVMVLLSASLGRAELSIRELFRETEGKILDFVILSSVETGYARDLIGGRNYVIAQFPVVYLTPYLTGEMGYLTGYDDSVRGALMFGGSLRINRLIEDIFAHKLNMIRSYIPSVDSTWDRLWVGPFVSKRFSDFDSTLLGGIKAGLRW